MFDYEKYRYYTNGNKVIAVSTYAGKTVRGTAKCDPKDAFDLEKGKKLAAARCAVKVAEKRVSRAGRKYDEATNAVFDATCFERRMGAYFNDALSNRDAAYDALNALLDEM